MNKKTQIILASIVILFLTIAGISLWQRNAKPGNTEYDQYQLSVIETLSSQNDYDALNLNQIILASAATGNLAENISGSSKAPVVIYEYADYMCGHCSQMNTILNRIVDDYSGKVAVVFRSYILDYNGAEGVMAASAANAAAMQGCWKEYKDLLFANQNEWYYTSGNKLMNKLQDYFLLASDGKGDLAKFQSDCHSDAVIQKVAFDRGIGEHIKIGGTPWLYLDGEWISNLDPNDKDKSLSMVAYDQHIRSLIDQKLQ